MSVSDCDTTDDDSDGDWLESEKIYHEYLNTIKCRKWRKNGYLHRLNGPALIEYYKNKTGFNSTLEWLGLVWNTRR